MAIISITVYFIFLAIILIASFVWPGILWAASWWSFIASPVAVILSILSLAFLFRGRPSPAAKSRELKPGTKLILYLSVPALSALLMWVLRNEYPLYGGLPAASRQLGEWLLFTSHHPIPQFINQLFFRFLNGTFLVSAKSSLAIMSIIAGVFYISASWTAAGIVAEESLEKRAISTLFLISGGFFAVFFGEGFVTLAVLFCFLHIISLERYASSGGSLLLPALTLYLAIFSHPVSVYLLPGFILAAVAGALSNKRRAGALAGAALFAGLWIGSEVLLRFVPPGYSYTGTMTSLLTSLPRRFEANELLVNISNNLIIIGPAALAALAFLAAGAFSERGSKTGGETEASHSAAPETHLYLPVTIISALLILFLENGLAGNGLKWAFFCAIGPAFSFYALKRLSSLGRRDFGRAASLLCAAGLIHAGGIIITNSSPEAAQERLLGLELPPGRAEHIIADKALENHLDEKALEYYKRAADADPQNGEAFFKLAGIHIRKRDYYKAFSSFSKALELEPENKEYRFAMAVAYLDAKWYREAIPHLKKLLEESKHNPTYWTKLGFALNHSQRFSEAVEAYEKALQLDLSNEDYRNNLASATLNRGLELVQKGDTALAKSHIQRGIRLNPKRSIGYANLAAIEMEEGNYERALQILNEALTMSTRIGYLTYLNLGLVYEKLGNNEEALKYLRKSREIEPMSSAAQHIKRIKENLKSEEE